MRPPRRSALWDYLEALLVAVIFATFARTFVVQAFEIPTGSMESNLLVGDHVLVNKFVYGPASEAERRWLPMRQVERGDVVVFKFPRDPDRDFIKRCVGLPGEEVELVDKVLRIDGTALDESRYAHHADPNVYPPSPLLAESFRLRDNFGPLRVPPDHYFCLGDNRDNSNDSRFWGPVPATYVRGRAFMIYWSFRGEDPGDGEKGDRWRRLLRTVGELGGRTRWERSFRIVR